MSKPRVRSRKDERATERGRAERAAAVEKRKVIARQDEICIAVRVNPNCYGNIWDAHELIPRSQGGPRESWNQVGVCRCCHREAQGRVGGNRLLFDWVGKADGAKPNADQLGNVRCSWRDRHGETAGRS